MVTQQAGDGADIALQARIDAKIADIRKVENDIPAMIIVHDIRNWHVVYMSERGRDYLGISMDALRGLGTDYHLLFFNPEESKDYAPQIFGLLERNNDHEMIALFQQVRQSPQHEWSWFLSGVQIILWDDDGKPVLTLTTATPVDAQHHIAAKAQKLLEENNFLRKNYHVFDTLTRQEREVLKFLALGMSSIEIADKLGISETTASTHRRNIKAKLRAKTTYDLSMFARAFDLI
jgi:DNA-binding CsgD family transcriptional regulator